jgi:hypothetical protein
MISAFFFESSGSRAASWDRCPAAAPTVSTPCANGALGCPGEWSPVIKFDPAVVAIHAHLLPNGKVLFWERWPSQPEAQWLNTSVGCGPAVRQVEDWSSR